MNRSGISESDQVVEYPPGITVNQVRALWANEINELRTSVEQLPNIESQFHELCALALGTLGVGGTIFIFGNGGSSADAAHFAAELTGRYKRKRRPLPAIHVGANSAEFSAISNDFGFEESFAMPLGALVGPDDLLLGLSTSGRSKNVLRAFEVGQMIGAKTCLFTGPNFADPFGDLTLVLRTPGSETARIQEMHHFILHLLAEVVDHYESEVKID